MVEEPPWGLAMHCLRAALPIPGAERRDNLWETENADPVSAGFLQCPVYLRCNGTYNIKGSWGLPSYVSTVATVLGSGLPNWKRKQ